MAPHNFVIIMADEHSSKVLGCYGHPKVKTPNMDKIAATGVAVYEHVQRLAHLRTGARSICNWAARKRHRLLG